MIEQVSTSVKFLAFYTASKTGKTGLTVTVDVYDPSGTAIVTAASATAIGGGLYSYTLSSNNSTEGEYAAIFKTSDSTVDAQHIPSLWVLGRAGVENLDAATSTRLPTSSYSAAPSVSAIRTEMDSNSTKLANLDASISSRLADADYTAPTAAPSVTAIRQEMDANSTKLSNLDAAVSTRLAAADYTAPTSAPTASAVASAVRTELTEISNLDASVSSRLAASSYTAPANSDISAIKAKTDALPASPAAVSDIPTAAQIATAVEGSILNENDGQAVLNAIVGAIGNTNVSEVSLVAAIRSDLERNGGKLDSIPTASAPSASTVASAVRTELSVELGRVDASVSSRLASADYTAPTSAPSASTVASAVRTELGTELGRIDATISSRLADADYVEPTAAPTTTEIWSAATRTLTSASGPTAAQIRAEIDSASTQLAAIKTKTDALDTTRLGNVSTVATTGAQLAAALS